MSRAERRKLKQAQSARDRHASRHAGEHAERFRKQQEANRPWIIMFWAGMALLLIGIITALVF